ncbi:MAG: superfamily II RNA helicase [Verrucomicrobiales bacterium]|jgi:superfamily II RNA helicase
MPATLEKITPTGPNAADDILNAFLDYVAREGLELYDHQEEAILEVFAGKNVILNTPTGSGKSLVALAMQFKSLCMNRRSFYTVPIKALANEKFLSLCRILGADQVGMMTGDATVNRDAPVICCTAEILSNMALREGHLAEVDDVIMDEFHYYSDSSRGVAWQLPLLTLSQSRFLLMSATLGDTKLFEETLTELTGAPTALVQSEQRPVPLEFDYSEISLAEKIVELVEKDRAPVYLVHFSQRGCAVSAQNLLSSNFCSKDEKRAIAEALKKASFSSPYGKEVSKLLRHGIGIHHAGLLPKYRVLIEKLTQKGLLKVICGTDTLGVGINVPIRTVVFTQLCKFDGTGTRILTVRDFKQICGRAGRRGFDNVGYVVSQAPDHVVENLRLEAKAAGQQGKRSKFVKKKPPEKGFVAWDEATYRKLIDSPPEKLVSSFRIQHSMLLNVLSRRDEDGCAALKEIIEKSHEPDTGKAAHRKHAFQLFRSLVEARVLDIIPVRERTGPEKVELNIDLQEDFSLNHALGLWLLDAIPELDHEAADYVFNMLSLVEALLENPVIVLRKQVDALKTQLMADMKREGIEYDERLARLDEVEWPKPGKEFIYATFNAFVEKHRWISDEGVRPKSIAREMFENYQSFDEYVRQYGLERSEGVLLRHLTEVYKVLSQTIPPTEKTEEVEEAEQFLEDIVRGVDSSLLDEWQVLQNPESALQASTDSEPKKETKPIPVTRNKKAFTRQLRNSIFNLLKSLASRNWADSLVMIGEQDPDGQAWSAQRLETELEAYFAQRHRIRLDPDARNSRHTYIKQDSGTWVVEQSLVDPEDENDWLMRLTVDLKLSDQTERPALQLQGFAPIGQ